VLGKKRLDELREGEALRRTSMGDAAVEDEDAVEDGDACNW
jgi:hypothetical protein